MHDFKENIVMKRINLWDNQYLSLNLVFFDNHNIPVKWDNFIFAELHSANHWDCLSKSPVWRDVRPNSRYKKRITSTDYRNRIMSILPLISGDWCYITKPMKWQ